MGIDDIIEEKAEISPGVTPPSVRQRQREVAEARESDLATDGGEQAQPTLAISDIEVTPRALLRFIEENPDIASAYLLGVNTALLFLILWKV